MDGQEKRFKRGDVREDGKIFWQYLKRVLNGEYWVSPERFLLLRETVKSCNKYIPIEERKHRRGDVREDGMIFWQYKKRSKNGESWLTKEKFLKELQTEKRAGEKFRKNNREQERIRLANVDAKRRAIGEGRVSHLSKDEAMIVKTIYKTRSRISQCTSISFHVDHIIPLAKGGEHKPSNLQLLPAKINIKKGARIFHQSANTLA